jgi:hypothetical protein
MALDPYALCPGGTGKKLKFCCSDLVSELDQIQHMIQGQQRHACLERINKLQTQYPGRACLCALKAELESELGLVDQAEKSVAQFAEQFPDNPIALADQALVVAGKAGALAAVPLLQRALANSSQELAHQVYEAIGGIAQMLLVEGHLTAARGHLMLQLRIVADDETAMTLLSRINGSASVPLLLKEDLPMAEAPFDAPWKAEFTAAMELARGVNWLGAAEKLTTLAERVPTATQIWQNLAVLRGWLGDEPGTVEALRRLVALNIPREDAVEAEARAQLLDNQSTGDLIDDLRVTYTVNNVDRMLELLASDKRAVRLPNESFPRQEGQVPPRVIYYWLDRPMPATGVDIAMDAVPNILGRLFVFGRETDREARLELELYRRDYDTAHVALTELSGDALGAPAEPEMLESIPAGQLVLSWNWRLPDDTPPDHLQSLLVRKRRDVILNRWPKTAQGLFAGRTPEQAADDPAERIKLQAAILLVELAVEHPSTEGLVNELRGRLGLPISGPIDPTTVKQLDRLPVVRLARVVVEKLSDDDLLLLYRRAMFVSARPALRKLAIELIARPSLDGKVDKAAAHGLLANLEPDPKQILEHLAQARKYAEKAGQSCARWDLTELAVRLQRGDGNEANELLRHVQARHSREQGVMQTLMQMLYEAGVIGPDGRPAGMGPALSTAPAGAPSILGGNPAAATETGKIWTPGSDTPAAGGKKSALWVPE